MKNIKFTFILYDSNPSGAMLFHLLFVQNKKAFINGASIIKWTQLATWYKWGCTENSSLNIRYYSNECYLWQKVLHWPFRAVNYLVYPQNVTFLSCHHLWNVVITINSASAIHFNEGQVQTPWHFSRGIHLFWHRLKSNEEFFIFQRVSIATDLYWISPCDLRVPVSASYHSSEPYFQ